MPFLRAEAPAGTPDEETIEYLLGQRHVSVKHRKKIKTIGELAEAERARAGLVHWGKRCDVVPGDPYGLWRTWAGNLSHHRDDRMNLLSKVTTTGIRQLAKDFSTDNHVSTLRDNAREVVVEFTIASKRIRLMQCFDIDLDEKKPFDKTRGYNDAEQRAHDLSSEAPMAIEVQQFLMARMVWENGGGLRGVEPNQQTETDINYKKFSKDLENLRTEAQETFWLHSTWAERDGLRDAASNGDGQIDHIITVIKAHWPRRWNNGRFDQDHFRHYLDDKIAAEQVWELVDADVFIVVDAKRRVVLANVESAAQLLFGADIVRELNRAIDMFSFFVPIPAPESKRHVVDRYIRRIHPYLDPAKATVAELPHAKVAVAHYGCWSQLGDPLGNHVFATSDCSLGGTRINHLPRKVFPRFCKSVFNKISEVVRLLVKPLDPDFYETDRTICQNVDKEDRIETTDDKFMSLFVLGINAYTQRHRDTCDLRGGLVGLVTLGEYTGENLCLPQLGVKVPYAPGACTVMRGDRMDHLVADYTGPRYFAVTTHHESVHRYVKRKLGTGLDPNLMPSANVSASEAFNRIAPDEEEDEDPVGFPLETPCINDGRGSDDSDDPPWTNWGLHEDRALDSSDSESSSYS
ncbi:uncharacterized protein PG986_010158 [Apiospora aurea]|uniref:Uncharacterized protein n=1 Tax=Apiospora aurea TaxID=335848 RepID=A0ABR1QAD8_9PEZI